MVLQVCVQLAVCPHSSMSDAPASRKYIFFKNPRGSISSLTFVLKSCSQEMFDFYSCVSTRGVGRAKPLWQTHLNSVRFRVLQGPENLDPKRPGQRPGCRPGPRAGPGPGPGLRPGSRPGPRPGPGPRHGPGLRPGS